MSNSNKNISISFNQTGKQVSKMRKCMLEFLENKENNSFKVEKKYRVKYWGGDQYFGINCSLLVITATSRLEAIVKLKDYCNQHAKYPMPFDSFQDDVFDDIVCEHEDIDYSRDPDFIFQSRHINQIIKDFVEHQFNNSSLWLEESE